MILIDCLHNSSTGGCVTQCFMDFPSKLCPTTEKPPPALSVGDLLRGKLSCQKNRKDPRSLDIVIRLEQSSFFPDVVPVKLEQKFVLQ